jgi:hypothetical protein
MAESPVILNVVKNLSSIAIYSFLINNNWFCKIISPSNGLLLQQKTPPQSRDGEISAVPLTLIS